MKALTEKIRSIGTRIFTVLGKSEKLTYKQLGKEASTSKSSAFRQLKGIERRNVHPESGLWEHEEGYEWLRRHFFATLLIFGVGQGIGADTRANASKRTKIQREKFAQKCWTFFLIRV